MVAVVMLHTLRLVVIRFYSQGFLTVVHGQDSRGGVECVHRLDACAITLCQVVPYHSSLVVPRACKLQINFNTTL